MLAIVCDITTFHLLCIMHFINKCIMPITYPINNETNQNTFTTLIDFLQQIQSVTLNLAITLYDSYQT